MSTHHSKMLEMLWIVCFHIMSSNIPEKISSRRTKASAELPKQRFSRVNSQVSPFFVCGIIPLLMIYSEAKFALDCFKRRSALEERFRGARTKSGKAGFVTYILLGRPLTVR